jgi:hypothetical protein
MKKLLLLLTLVVLASLAKAQTLTDNGKIKYKIDLTGVDDPQVAAMFKDASMEIGFLNGRYRMDMSMPMVRTRSFSVGDSSVVLMDMMGNKMMMMMSRDEVNSRKLDESSYDVKETKEMKTIAGYKAKKYNIKTKDGKEFTVYATEELPIKLAEYSPYTKVKGAPLEYEMSQGPYKMLVTAQEVKAGTESDASFKYDDAGYTRTTAEQMMRMMGGGQKSNNGHDHSDPNHKH